MQVLNQQVSFNKASFVHPEILTNQLDQNYLNFFKRYFVLVSQSDEERPLRGARGREGRQPDEGLWEEGGADERDQGIRGRKVRHQGNQVRE